MRAVPRCFPLIAPLALAVAVVCALPEPPRAAAEEEGPASPPRSPGQSLGQTYECTAIGEVIKANGGRVPRNGTELVKALGKLGAFAQLPVPFSAVALESGLTHPRVVIAPIPGRAVPGRKADDDDDDDEPARPTVPPKGGIKPPVGGVKPPVGGLQPPLGGIRPPTLPGTKKLPSQLKDPTRSVLSSAKVTQPHVEGRLFLAANMEAGGGQDPKVRTIEFISWNSRKKKFDFGVIDCTAAEPEIKVLDGVRCFACHKNRGPILGQGPWSNTTHNDHVRAAALAALDPSFHLPEPPAPPKKGGTVPKRPVDPDDLPDPFGALPPGFGQPFPGQPFGGLGGLPTAQAGFPRITPAQRAKTTFDGMSLVAGDPEVCDFAVRVGGDVARDREVYRAMTKSADGRRALVLVLGAIAAPPPPAELARQIDLTYNATSANFAEEFVVLNKSMSSTLGDYSPSGSVGSLKTVTTNQPASWGSGSSQRTDTVLAFSGSPKSIGEYDQKRSTGEHGMPSNRMPSNPRSFIRTPVPVPPRPSAAVNPTHLARMIGLSEGDRQFMTRALDDLAQAVNKPKVTAVTLARDVFNSPAFADALKAGDIPDREDFKDRFVEGLQFVAKANSAEEPKFRRGEYASGPNCAPLPGQQDREPVVVPSTACLGCHDVRGVTKQSAFNPIPMLAFDPFDKTGRDTWVRSNNAKDREKILARMLKRLVSDKDMPPEDSAEYERFRQKDPAAFDALKEWLDAELKKAKGN